MFADAQRDMRHYEIYDKLKSEEYLHDITGEQRGHQQGDSCTINGSRGTMRLINNKWVCVPNARARGDARDHQAIMDALYREHDEYLQNAWRGTDQRKTRVLDPRGREQAEWVEEGDDDEDER